MSEQRIFLMPKLETKERDRAVLSPVWLIPAEIFSRGMLKRPTYRYNTIVLDAMTGSPVMILEGDVPWKETTTFPEGRVLEPAIERSRASFFAEKAIGNSKPQGWRSIGNFCSVHVDAEKAKLRWRPILLREGIPLDGLTGTPLVGSELLTALLAETIKKGGS